MEIFIGWVAFSVLAGIIASTKNRSGFGYFVLSVVLSPLVGLIAAAAMPKIDANAPNPSTHVKCPDCRELVLKDARKCKHCGSALRPPDPNHPACPSCGKIATPEAKHCPSCGHNMH